MKPFFLTGLLVLAVVSLNAAEPSAHLKELRSERSQLRRAISKAVPNLNERDPELAKLERGSIDTAKALEKGLREHPSLAAFNDQLKAANDRLVLAITKKDDAAKQAAQDEISAIQHQRLEAGMKIPEIQALSATAQGAAEAWHKRKDELLASLPETKDLVKRMNDLNGQIAEELKKQRP